MANEATAELYTRQSGINKAKFKTDYDQYLADLATKFGISQDQLNSNLEARGILRSGEAGTAQARLGAANEAARTTATSNYDYNVATEDVDLLTKLAGLQAGSAGSGGSGTPTTPTTPTEPATPREDAPLPSTAPVVYRGGTTQGQLPQAPLPTAAPRPVATPAPTQGQLPSGMDLSGVDFAALGRYMDSMNKPKTKSVVYGGGATQGQLPQAPLPKTKPGTTSFNPIPARMR